MDAIHNKLLTRGVGSLTDAELLSLIVDDGGTREDALKLGERILAENGTIANIGNMDISRLRMVEGVGLKRAGRILAAAELGRRLAALQVDSVASITSSSDAVNIFRPLFEGLQHEECWVLFLNRANRLIGQEMVSSGAQDVTLIDRRMILRRALEKSASAVIVVHNHPSGNPLPSVDDVEQTRELGKALKSCGLQLVDHVIVSGKSYYSFSDERVEGQ